MHFDFIWHIFMLLTCLYKFWNILIKATGWFLMGYISAVSTAFYLFLLHLTISVSFFFFPIYNMLLILYDLPVCTHQVYGALRMTVKIFLMWNSKMLIDGGEDTTVATSWLEASNLVVLKVFNPLHLCYFCCMYLRM